MKDTVKLGVIGSGMIGQEHIRNIAHIPNAAVTAVCDPNDTVRHSATALAGSQCSPYTDYTHMLQHADINAVLISTPNYTHFDILQDVLKTDLPILVEKPLCTTSADCQVIVQSTKNRNAPVWVAMEYRYMPPIAELIQYVHTQKIGTLKTLNITEHRFPFLDKIDHWNRFSEKTGGTLVEKCCHFFDLMRLITQSEPTRIYASGGQDVNHLDEVYNGKKSDILDNAFAIIDFASGVRGVLELCMFAEGSYFQEHISCIGHTGKIEAFVPGCSRFWTGGKQRHAEIVHSPRYPQNPIRRVIEVDAHILQAGDHHGSTFYQMCKFCDMVLSGTNAPQVTVHDGAMAVKMGGAAETSIRTGLPVDLP